jgi:hypothetical protein
MSSVSQQIESNKHLGVGLEDFVKMREQRDASLGSPRLLHASLQVNLRAGRMPPPDEMGRRFIRTPLKGDLP